MFSPSGAWCCCTQRRWRYLAVPNRRQRSASRQESAAGRWDHRTGGLLTDHPAQRSPLNRLRASDQPSTAPLNTNRDAAAHAPDIAAGTAPAANAKAGQACEAAARRRSSPTRRGAAAAPVTRRAAPGRRRAGKRRAQPAKRLPAARRPAGRWPCRRRDQRRNAERAASGACGRVGSTTAETRRCRRHAPAPTAAGMRRTGSKPRPRPRSHARQTPRQQRAQTSGEHPGVIWPRSEDRVGAARRSHTPERVRSRRQRPETGLVGVERHDVVVNVDKGHLRGRFGAEGLDHHVRTQQMLSAAASDSTLNPPKNTRGLCMDPNSAPPPDAAAANAAAGRVAGLRAVRLR